MNVVTNAHAAEDPTVREARLRRRNRMALLAVGTGIAILLVLGYLYGGWLLQNPPPSNNFH